MITQKIKLLMKEKKVTNVQMAEYLGISPQSLANKFNRGHYSIEEVIKILDFLGCQLVIQNKPEVNILLTMNDLRAKD